MTMNIWKRLTALVVIATFLSLQVHPAVLADDSDIFGANIQPNVVLMIDNSGSMGDSAPSNTFDVPPPSGTAAYYPVLNNCDPAGKPKVFQPCASVKVYKSSQGNTYSFYADSVAAVGALNGGGPAQTAINSAGYWSGKINGSSVNLYTGNYLNYLLGTCASGGACSKPKMTIAKEVVNALLDSVQGVRFGVMTFHYDSLNNGDGAKVVAQVAAAPPGSLANSALHSAINSLQPTGNTPLGDALYDVGQYYRGQRTGNGTQGPFTS